MNDNGDEIPLEVKEIVEKGVEIANILSSIDDAAVASKAISIAIAHLLCYRMKDEEAAHAMFDMIIDDADSAVMTTKKYGFTSWIEGTPQ